jgi:hypothetical protein
MFNQELIYRARWDQLYAFFFEGNTPLALQLLIINTIFLVFFIVKRARAKNRQQQTTAYAVQGLLIATNAAVMFQKDFWGLASSAQSIMRF